ncbi:MAG: hypothetical protein V1837_06680 [Candidatus Woesearchaeota archaeon]
MKLFSQRQGYREIDNIMQIESMNKDLRTGLVNVFSRYISSLFYKIFLMQDEFGDSDRIGDEILNRLCDEFFKEEYGEMANVPQAVVELHSFIKEKEWNLVYDLFDFCVICLRDIGSPKSLKVRDELVRAANTVLERENAGYRFINDQITPITDKHQITEILTALESRSKEVKTHLETALRHLSDRNKPDYRNSIKESISAVEAIAVRFAGKENSAVLTKALDHLERQGVRMHPALKAGYEKIYGYTSDSDGVRHGMLGESNLDQEDARYLLVACAAFINYLEVKCSKAGLQL